MSRLSELGSTPGARAATAESFARQHQIDLASAYSVLLGLMDLSDACSLRQMGTADRRTIAHMTNAGDRSIRASALAFRHDLPLRLAFDVANGKLPLEEALRRARAEPERPWPGLEPRKSTDRRPLLVRLAPVAIGLAVGGLVAVQSTRETSQAMGSKTPASAVADASARPTETPARARGFSGLPQVIDPPTYETIETTDDQGRITRITGKTPRSVLEAFCAAGGPGDTCEPQEIVPCDPPRTGVKIGLLQKRFEPGRQFAIWLRRDERSGDWFAGNGARPLEAYPYQEPTTYAGRREDPYR